MIERFLDIHMCIHYNYKQSPLVFFYSRLRKAAWWSDSLTFTCTLSWPAITLSVFHSRLRKVAWWSGSSTSTCTSRPRSRRQTWGPSVCTWPWTCCTKRLKSFSIIPIDLKLFLNTRMTVKWANFLLECQKDVNIY